MGPMLPGSSVSSGQEEQRRKAAGGCLWFHDKGTSPRGSQFDLSNDQNKTQSRIFSRATVFLTMAFNFLPGALLI